MRRLRHSGNILIDLTSLLDVIFIVLLVVVCQLQSSKSAIAKNMEEIRSQQAEVQTQKELFEDQLDSLGKVSDYVAFISVNAHFDADLITRHIKVMNSDQNSEIPEIADLKGLSVTQGFNDLREYLDNYLQENPERTVVLSLNEGDEDILYRDEKEIKRIFDELAAQYSNVIEK